LCFPHSWVYRYKPPRSAFLLRWCLANFLPEPTSNCDFPASDSQVAGDYRYKHHTWL
jgi:hypothetical protein